jgi:hypothetical protein
MTKPYYILGGALLNCETLTYIEIADCTQSKHGGEHGTFKDAFHALIQKLGIDKNDIYNYDEFFTKKVGE